MAPEIRSSERLGRTLSAARAELFDYLLLREHRSLMGERVVIRLLVPVALISTNSPDFQAPCSHRNQTSDFRDVRSGLLRPGEAAKE